MSIITFKTQTAAIGAGRALRRSGISASVISVDPSLTTGGCGYGLEVDNRNAERALSVLRAKNISFGTVIGR